jgi:hypothetical protein
MKRAIVHVAPPHAPPPVVPARGGYGREWRVALQLLRLASSAAALASLPAGRGAPVLLVPGWKAPEATMEPLRLFLRAKGFDVRHWGLGANGGDVARDRELLAHRARALSRERGRPVGLVGWSLGGVLAREAARLCAKALFAVATFGTPAVGGPTFTQVAPAWGPRVCAELAERARYLDETEPIGVPLAAIFSRRDEVVCWSAAIDRQSPRATHFEVDSPHFAMGVDPAVWSVICQHLADHS